MKNMKKITEKELLRNAIEDEQAFTELYRRYHDLVYYVAYKLCRNDADAKDIMQDTFIEVQRSLKDLKNPQYFRLWLYRVIDSKCKKLFRKNKFIITDIEQDHIQNECIEESQANLPDKTIKAHTDQEVLSHFIDELPYQQKIAVILYYMEQRTTLEISKILDIPEGTIKSRLSSARSTLKKKIEAYEHREHIKLNFHSLDAGLVAFFGHTSSMLMKAPKGNGITTAHSFITTIKASATGVKTALALGVTLVATTGGIFLYHAIEKQDQIVHQANKGVSFPTVIFQGKEINTSKEAYYTLKQHICIQDIVGLDGQQRTEADQVVSALKTENGVFYQQLKETGWLSAYEK